MSQIQLLFSLIILNFNIILNNFFIKYVDIFFHSCFYLVNNLTTICQYKYIIQKVHIKIIFPILLTKEVG